MLCNYNQTLQRKSKKVCNVPEFLQLIQENNQMNFQRAKIEPFSECRLFSSILAAISNPLAFYNRTVCHWLPKCFDLILATFATEEHRGFYTADEWI